MSGQTPAQTNAPMHQREPEGANGGYAACRHCRVAFKPTAAWQHFCSTPCRREWHKAKKGKRIRLIDLEARVTALERRVAELEGK
jgi:predicted nucleic acid-binding Zn ribbon protein